MGELMTATHNFGTAPIRAATTADTFKAALYLTSATVNAATTAYSSTGEVTGTGYTAGGVTVTNATAPIADAVLIYNSSQSNKAVSVHTFGSQTITAGTFTLTMPSNTTSTALLRLSTT